MTSLDERLLRLMRTNGHAPAVERAVARFSTLGEHGALWLAIGACGWITDPPRRASWGRAIGAVATAYAANTAIKLLLRRPRPRLPGLPPLASTPTQLSFPSAHTATAFAGALAYARLGLPRGPLYGLATATGLSRPYLGLHHPSDVLAGAVLGTAVAAAMTASRPAAAEPSIGAWRGADGGSQNGRAPADAGMTVGLREAR